jgi:histidinol-phosphatase (PHP family)
VSSIAGGADLHVHSEWSWDAPSGSMRETCALAAGLGLRVVAFTDHADYTAVADGRRLDLDGYRDGLARCRREFPRLAIWSGVELGEPHRFPAETAELLAQGDFDLVLGSVHAVEIEGQLVDCSSGPGGPERDPVAGMRLYWGETLRLLESVGSFQVLAHLEYPKRYWPGGRQPYRAADFREEIQAVLERAAELELILEINSSAGLEPGRGLCPGPEVVRWWRAAGGRAVSIGSDAHRPDALGRGLDLALEAAALAGFQAGQILGGALAARPPVPSGRTR